MTDSPCGPRSVCDLLGCLGMNISSLDSGSNFFNKFGVSIITLLDPKFGVQIGV